MLPDPEGQAWRALTKVVEFEGPTTTSTVEMGGLICCICRAHTWDLTFSLEVERGYGYEIGYIDMRNIGCRGVCIGVTRGAARKQMNIQPPDLK
jgi:hypothetical protein